MSIDERAPRLRRVSLALGVVGTLVLAVVAWQAVGDAVRAPDPAIGAEDGAATRAARPIPPTASAQASPGSAGADDRVTRQDGVVTVEPAALPSSVPVGNPGKGWVVYGPADDYADAPLDALADLADVSFTRWSWTVFYTDPSDASTLDFGVVDDFFEGWLARDSDRELAFGVMAENTGECTAERSITPTFVFDDGAASVQSGECRTPVFTDPVFLGAYAGMLVQLRDHLASRTEGTGDGSTWLSRVQFVGVNSYGNYGEGHTYRLGEGSCGPGARFEQVPGTTTCVISTAGFLEHAQMFLDVFTPSATPVMVPWGSGTLDADGVYDWAVEQGMGLRRDGIFGPSEFTRGRLGSDLRRAFGLAPTAFERYDTSAALNPSREDFETALQTGRPSFFGLGYPDKALAVWQRDPDLVADNQRRLGYDFSLDRVDLPARWASGADVQLALRWRNDGLDYTYEAAREGFALLDETGRAVATSYPATGANPQRWAPGTTTDEQPTVRFVGVAPGRYRLAVGVSDARAGRPLRLAQQGTPTAEGWYPLTEVTLTDPVPLAGLPAVRPVVVEPELVRASTIGSAEPGVVARSHVLLRDERLSSGMGDRFNAVDPGDAISYPFTVPRSGRWAIDLRTLDGPAGGSLQVAVGGVEVGDAVDTGAPVEAVAEREVGYLDLPAGSHRVLLTATGPRTGTGSTFVVDRITLRRTGPTPTPAPAP